MSSDTEPQAGQLAVLTWACIFEDRPEGDVTFEMTSPEHRTLAQSTPVVLKEGCHYKMRAAVQVSGEVVSGVKFVAQTYRKGLRVAKDQQMLGSFGPQDKPHEVTFPRHGWEDAPSGLLSRGSYTVKASLLDDDGRVLDTWEWAFDVKSHW